jgi:hypothetical protein
MNTNNDKLNRFLHSKLDNVMYHSGDDDVHTNRHLLFALNEIFSTFNSVTRLYLAMLDEEDWCVGLSHLQQWWNDKQKGGDMPSVEKIVEFCSNETFMTIEHFISRVIIPYYGRLRSYGNIQLRNEMLIEFLVRSLVPATYSDEKTRQQMKNDVWDYFNLMLRAPANHETRSYFRFSLNKQDMQKEKAIREMREADTYDGFLAAYKAWSAVSASNNDSDSHSDNDDDNDDDQFQQTTSLLVI